MAEMDLIIVLTSTMNEWKPNSSIVSGVRMPGQPPKKPSGASLAVFLDTLDSVHALCGTWLTVRRAFYKKDGPLPAYVCDRRHRMSVFSVQSAEILASCGVPLWERTSQGIRLWAGGRNTAAD